MRRDYLITRSYRNTFIFELFLGIINMLVYYYISKTFEGVASADLQGAPSYFDFAVVGTILTVVIGATSTQIAAQIRQEQLAGTLEALFIQPLRATEVALGLIGLPFLWAMVRAAVYVAAAALFMGLDVSSANWAGAALTVAAAGTAMGVLGIGCAAFVLIFKRGALVTGMILFAMGFVSGAVFPVSVLPEWIQPVGEIVPTRFAFDGLRTALFGGMDWYGDALALTIFAGVFLPLAIWSFAGGLAWTRRQGSLAQY